MWLRVRGWWSLQQYEARDPERARELLVNTQHLYLVHTEQGRAVLDLGIGDALFYTDVPIDKLANRLHGRNEVVDLRY